MNLDDKQKILAINPENTSEAILKIPDQITQTLDDLKDLKFPKSYHKVNKVLVSAMGGSKLGGLVAESLFRDELTVPLMCVGDYDIPHWVDETTLFYASSYSGNTEETLTALGQAMKKGAQIVTFTTGGKLAVVTKEYNLPSYIADTTETIGDNAPRYSLGHQIVAVLMILEKLELLKFNNAKLHDVVKLMKQESKKYDLPVPESKNLAKKIARQFQDKIVNLVSCEHMMGNIHVMRNQFTESGKQFAAYIDIPEMNHFQMEGLPNPKHNQKNLLYFFVESELFHVRNQKRIAITKKVLEKNGIKYVSYKLQGKDKIQQSFELLNLGSFVTYYLGLLNGDDPAPNPWVDYFKKELA